MLRGFKPLQEFWLNLQSRFDLQVAIDKTQSNVEREVQPLEAVSAYSFRIGSARPDDSRRKG